MRATATAVFFSLSLPTVALAAPPTPPPAFPPGTTTDVIQGVKVADPYRALENAADPAVQAWSDAQNARTRAWLDALPGRAGVAAELTRLITTASPAYYDLQGRGGAVFGLYNDPTKQQPALVVMNSSADPASRKALVDPNVMDPTGHTAIDWYVASPDGAKVALSLSLNGSEDGTLHLYDVASGREIEAPIARVQYPTAGGSLAWTADSRAFWYTRYPDDTAPEAERHFNLAVYFHRLGGDARTDRLALGARDGLPRTGEIYLDNRAGAVAALASVELGDGGQFQQFVLTPEGPARPIGAYGDHVAAAAMARDGAVFGVSRLNAPMGKILRLDAPYTGGFAAARTIVPEDSKAAVINGGEFSAPLTVAGDRLFVSRIAGGPSLINVYDLKGGQGAYLALPPVSSVGEIDALPGGDVLYDVSTYLTPTYFMRLSTSSGMIQRTALARTSPISYADTEVVRAFAASKDGTKVPVNIIRKKTTRLTGANPTLLTGYGGYGVNLTPSFAGANIRLWLDAGGVWAIANLRGGGEYGEAW
ncbi:MAG: S9 family peptidase, partial [Pseudomonadota bacterium]